MVVFVDTSRPELPAVTLTWGDVYPGSSKAGDAFFEPDWVPEVQFLVGRNGSGKTRIAKAMTTAMRVAGRTVHYLSADRLAGISAYAYATGGAGGYPQEYKGAGTDDWAKQQSKQAAESWGTANDTLHVLREQPDTLLRLAALVRRAFGRRLRLAEKSGFLDPVVELDGQQYSLLREEGHGLRELVILLTAVYRTDWELLLVDEPELHLHPSLSRLWLQELQAECRSSGRRAVVITHEPRLLTPTTWDDMTAIWVTQPQKEPTRLGEKVPVSRRADVEQSLSENPQLVGDLVFSPRPVLVEGVGDVAAFTTTASRVCAREEAAQTDFIACGGKSKIPLWLQIARDAHLDVRVIADLDALFDTTVRAAVDPLPLVRQAYADDLHLTTASTPRALQPVTEAIGQSQHVPVNDTDRARAAAALDKESPGGRRLSAVLGVWRRAGVWLHPEGAIEDVLGMPEHAKSVNELRNAAAASDALTEAVTWAVHRNGADVDLFELLTLEVERVGTALLAELRYSPEATFDHPVGPTAETDERLVSVAHVKEGVHRLTVRSPARYKGYWVEIDRGTPVAEWNLQPPVGDGPSS
ncbi:AAA family ATPase [Cellulosimicrobium sp. 4261]|uniref:ATP-dependent nuclease n=1 Tax=Cellulosimicrobium sp. 4261 TaxID=3156458 RepID=UPI003397F405